MKYKTERQRNKNFLLKDGDYTSTKDILERIAKYIPDKNIFADLDEKDNIVYHNSKELLSEVEAIGDGLIDLGLENKHIVITADNSYRYVLCDLAISGGVGVVTPIDKDANIELLTLLLTKCDADAIICSFHMLDKIKKAQEQCPRVKTIITIDKKVEGYTSLDEIIEKGKMLGNKAYYKNKKLDLAAPAKLLFTSGTTGPNKCVILSQNNLAANALNCMEMKCEKDEINTSMSILPMHHATEINTHIMTRIASGRLTYINDSMKNMMRNIKIFKPYVITIVPMIANVFYNTIWTNAKKAGKEEILKKGIKLCNMLKKLGIDITHKLFKDVYEPFGGNLRQIVCGGAMLNPEVVKGFRDLGVYIVNGYGITECGPLISMNTDTVNEVYSLGIPCPALEAKIINPDENQVGELCIKGKSVSLGYYKDKEATEKVFDKDGFFHTGDLAKIDKKGRIYLTGRKKNAIVLANGKNVCPEEIEHEISLHLPQIKECVVYQEEYQNQGKTQKGICVCIYSDDSSVLNNKDQLKEDFRNLNKLLPNYKHINYVCVTQNEFEKTSTRKIKRDNISKYHDGKNGIIL